MNCTAKRTMFKKKNIEKSFGKNPSKKSIKFNLFHISL